VPDQQSNEYTFFAESLGAEHMQLSPGDLISYYATASDRDKRSDTDMFLIDIRPFDRSWTEAGGGGGGGGGGQAGGATDSREISRRQREILVATWNLQRAVGVDASQAHLHNDNAQLLADLQITLQEQAITLANRTEARELVSTKVTPASRGGISRFSIKSQSGWWRRW